MTQENRFSPVATIKAGQSVSDVLTLDRLSLLAFIAPTVWTAAQLSIEASVNGATWLTTLLDANGNIVGTYAAPVAGAGYAVDPVAFMAYRYLRFRSGTAGAPVNQAADAEITAVLRSLA